MFSTFLVKKTVNNMDTITIPMKPFDKVVHLLKIADHLKILNDKMFDKLMDKSEFNRFYFDYMLETINLHIIEKKSVEDLKDVFIVLLNHDKIGKAMSDNLIKKLWL